MEKMRQDAKSCQLLQFAGLDEVAEIKEDVNEYMRKRREQRRTAFLYAQGLSQAQVDDELFVDRHMNVTGGGLPFGSLVSPIVRNIS